MRILLVSPYFPPQPRYNKPSFRQLMASVTEDWTDDRQGVRTRANEITQLVRESRALGLALGGLDGAREDAGRALCDGPENVLFAQGERA